MNFFFVVLCHFRKAALLFGWAVFLFLAYKVSKLDREYQEYNPYEVLNLDAVRTAFLLSLLLILFFVILISKLLLL